MMERPLSAIGVLCLATGGLGFVPTSLPPRCSSRQIGRTSLSLSNHDGVRDAADDDGAAAEGTTGLTRAGWLKVKVGPVELFELPCAAFRRDRRFETRAIITASDSFMLNQKRNFWLMETLLL